MKSTSGVPIPENSSAIPAHVHPERALKVRYKNWRDEVSVREIIPLEIFWGKTEWHPHEQYLLKVWDVERHDYRIYALQDIQEFIK